MLFYRNWVNGRVVEQCLSAIATAKRALDSGSHPAAVEDLLGRSFVGAFRNNGDKGGDWRWGQRDNLSLQCAPCVSLLFPTVFFFAGTVMLEAIGEVWKGVNEVPTPRSLKCN